jgi:hypothetical protein
VKGIKWGFKNK